MVEGGNRFTTQGHRIARELFFFTVYFTVCEVCLNNEKNKSSKSKLVKL